MTGLQAHSSDTQSAAEMFVRQVATKIGLADVSLLNRICESLRREYILEEWQLSALDSHQWQQLEAPMGLSSAIRLLASVPAPVGPPVPPPSTPEVDLPSSLLSSSKFQASSTSTAAPPSPKKYATRRLSAFRPASSTSRLPNHYSPATSVSHAVPETHKEMDEESPEISGLKSNTKTPKDSEPNNSSSGPPPPSCIRSFTRGYREYTKVSTNKTTFRKFPASPMFQQALLHSKSGPELKAHTVFVMELSILASALFLGAAVEMWGAFPMDSIADGPLWIDSMDGGKEQMPFVPRNLAIIYHFFAAGSLIVQLFITSGWIWILHATAAVSPYKFHQFLLQTRYVFSNFILFAELGAVLLTSNICLLFIGMVTSTTTDPIVRQCCYYMPTVLIALFSVMVHRFTSFIGRVAYHGLLLMDYDPVPTQSSATDNNKSGDGKDTHSKNFKGSALTAEAALAESFWHDNIRCERKVLDMYHEATHVSNASDHAEWYPSLFDVMFPSRQSVPQKSYQQSNKTE